MKKNTICYFAWLVVAIALGVFLFWFFMLRSASQEAQAVPVEVGDSASSTISMTSAAADGYRVVVPTTWYIEKNSASGITLYPDYDPQAQVPGQPSCKIEISALPNKSNASLGDWLDQYLKEDPTATMTEVSESSSQVSKRDAIIWAGVLNGVSTTAAYVAGDTVVYEIAPSKIEGNDCQAPFKVVLDNLTITAP